jgi:predicted ATP-binding protein involved in virulence
MNEERSSVTAIFEKFHVSKGTYEADLDRHVHLAQKALESFSGDKPTFKDFMVIYDVMRLHSLVEQWGKLQAAQKKIYQPKSEFVEIASDMLFRKSVTINRSNQVTVTSDERKSPVPTSIPIRKLSSGEKQLLIFLSETLLQEQEPYVFLADEPELSLHIEWQEDLVPSLLRINPNAQVIFATHSPDVVNKYQSNLIMMEELID